MHLYLQDTMSNNATAIEKTLEILLSFKPHNQPVGTSELSKKLGYHKATTSRILLTLAEYGFLAQDHATKKFTLGSEIYELGMVLTETSVNKIVQIARPHIDALRDELDETIALEVWSGNSTLAAYEVHSNRPLRVAGRFGKTPPVHVAAGAKAILSVADDATIDAALSGKLQSYTDHTITDPHILRERLKTYKRRGFATDNDELDIGISAIGAPIFDHRGTAIAAIVVLSPTARFTDDPESKSVTALKAAAAAISGQFFYKIKAL